MERAPKVRLGERLESECQPGPPHPEGTREPLTAFKQERTFLFNKIPSGDLEDKERLDTVQC